MQRPKLNPVIDALPWLVPFVGPEALERARGKPFRARLGANENCFGPSPTAIAAMRAAAEGNWKYSDPENYDLRCAIAAHHGIGAENVVVGEGIDGLLGLTCMLFVSEGDHVVTTDGAYPTFNFHVAAHGGRLTKIAMRDNREDLGALVEAANKLGACVLYLSNPNSPMGSWWQGASILDALSALNPATLVILDEAYADTAPAGTAAPIDTGNPRLLRLRTFSKAYGLAGARIGYAAGSAEWIGQFEKVRNHYGINRVGQIGALAALADQTYLAAVVTRIDAARLRLSAIAEAHGFAALPSAASFVAIDCGRDAAYAKAILDGLQARDVFVRKPVAAGIDHVIRVSCGPDAELDIFAEELAATRKALG